MTSRLCQITTITFVNKIILYVFGCSVYELPIVPINNHTHLRNYLQNGLKHRSQFQILYDSYEAQKYILEC